MMKQIRAFFFSVEGVVVGALAAYGFVAALGWFAW